LFEVKQSDELTARSTNGLRMRGAWSARARHAMRTDNAQPSNDSDHVMQTIKSQRTACCSSYHSVTTKKMRGR